MRILYVGNGAYKSRGANYYNDGRKWCNGFIRNSHNVYFLSDRDTSRAGNVFRSSKLGVGYCNKVFIDVCKNFQPEMIVLVSADIIKSESLLEVRASLPKAKIVQICVDALFSQNKLDIIQKKMLHVDATFITTAGSILGTIEKKEGVISYIPNPIDSSVETLRCHEHSDQEKDVFWACKLTSDVELNKDNPRYGLPLYLEESGQVKVDYYGMNNKPTLYGAPYYHKIGNARMGLNINQGNFMSDFVENSEHNNYYLYSSDRISHYMGCGLLVLCYRDKKYDSQLEDLFEENKELVFFSSKEELLDKVTYYIDHDEERKEIARRGWEKSHKHLNEKLLTKYITEVTFNLPLSEDYIWPTELY
ncbi:glycosyltransferase [Thermodesulfobacteriota bacterium]